MPIHLAFDENRFDPALAGSMHYLMTITQRLPSQTEFPIPNATITRMQTQTAQYLPTPSCLPQCERSDDLIRMLRVS